MKKNKFLKNILILMFSQIIIKILGFFYKIYLTNKSGYGDKGNAIFSAGFQIYAMLLTLSSIGIPNAISKIVSRKRAENKIGDAYRILKISIAVFSLIGFFFSLLLYFCADSISTNIVQIPETSGILKLLAPSIFIVSIIAVFKGYFNGMNQIKKTACSQNIEQILKTILTIILVEVISRISNDTKFMVQASAFAITLSLIITLLYIYFSFINDKKKIIIKKCGEYERVFDIIKEILYATIPIAICAFLSVATKVTDSVSIIRIIKKYIGIENATKQYGILTGKVETIINLPLSLNIALSTTLVPTISYLMAKNKKNEIKRKIKQSILLTLIIGIPYCIILLCFANNIFKILFPNAIDGINMLRFNSFSIIFSMLIQTINGILQGIGQTRICIKSLFCRTNNKNNIECNFVKCKIIRDIWCNHKYNHKF